MKNREEIANDWLQTDYAKAVMSLPIEQVKMMLDTVFLAGYEAAEAKFRPVKIEKDRPETWPPADTFVFWKLQVDFWEYNKASAEFIKDVCSSGQITYWFEIPEIGE